MTKAHNTRVKKETPFLGVRLRKLRRDKNLTQQIIAEKLGLSRDSAYQKYETGVSVPPADKLAKLAELFDVTTDYLLGREPEKTDADALLADLPNLLRYACRKDFDKALAAAGDDIKKLDHLRQRLSEHGLA